MVKLFTLIPDEISPWSLTYSDRILCLGSCFADNIANKMGEYYFNVVSNPFGTLYNPISISHHMDSVEVERADVLIITFGTAWVYIKKDTCAVNPLDAVVDNCMKQPAQLFMRYRLQIEEIVNIWIPILNHYCNKRFIFTVSPIRHLKDGMHENQLSKAILLLALDNIIQHFKDTSNNIRYFPSYEIMLDELRDYRFYSNDLFHPSSLAMNRIWEYFMGTYLNGNTMREEMDTLHQLYLDTSHRIMHPDTEDAKRFIINLSQRFSILKERYPWITMKMSSNNQLS